LKDLSLDTYLKILPYLAATITIFVGLLSIWEFTRKRLSYIRQFKISINEKILLLRSALLRKIIKKCQELETISSTKNISQSFESATSSEYKNIEEETKTKKPSWRTRIGTKNSDVPCADSFGDRLRAQREAAEALARKRSQVTQDRLFGKTSS